MAFTALERILSTERLRQRAARQGGFSIPTLSERAISNEEGPFLVTNARGKFLSTRLSRDGLVRYGFSHVPVGTDDCLLKVLHETLFAMFNEVRCTNVQEALMRLAHHNLEPKTVVASPALLNELAPGVSVEQARYTMQTQSQVAEVNGLTLLLADLPGRAGFVATAPSFVGTYTRAGDYLGVLLQRVGKSLLVIA